MLFLFLSFFFSEQEDESEKEITPLRESGIGYGKLSQWRGMYIMYVYV